MFKQLAYVVSAILLVAGSTAAQETMKHKDGGNKVTVIVKHAVKDYAAWKPVYDADAPNRKTAGFKVSGVYTDVKDPNMVFVVGTFPSEDAANAFISSPKLKEAMEKAGVMGPPEITMMKFMAGK